MYRTGAVVAVLSALDDTRWRYAWELAGLTGYDSSCVSHVLARLEAAGLAVSRWEEPEEAADGAADGSNRGRRHYFRLTDAGVRQALQWGNRKLEGGEG